MVPVSSKGGKCALPSIRPRKHTANIWGCGVDAPELLSNTPLAAPGGYSTQRSHQRHNCCFWHPPCVLQGTSVGRHMVPEPQAAATASDMRASSCNRG